MPHITQIKSEIFFGKENLTSENIWIDLTNMNEKFNSPRAALFLDRDGVIIEDTHYLCDVSDIRIIESTARLIAKANTLGLAVIIITNQSGIGRGYFNWSHFIKVQNELSFYLQTFNAKWDVVLACPHHLKGTKKYYHPAHPFRKPQAGMLHAAAELVNIDLSRSWLIGDKITDIQAGSNAYIKGAVFFSNSEMSSGTTKKILGLQTPTFKVHVSNDFDKICKLIM